MREVKKLPWKWIHAFLFITPQLLWEFLDPYRDFLFSPWIFPESSRQSLSCKHYPWEVLGARILVGFQGNVCHRYDCSLKNLFIQYLKAVHRLPKCHMYFKKWVNLVSVIMTRSCSSYSVELYSVCVQVLSSNIWEPCLINIIKYLSIFLY